MPEADVQKFGNRGEAKDFIYTAIGGVEAAKEVSESIMGAFADACELREETNARHLGFVVGCWVIRDDDLDLFRAVRDAIVTLASANFFLKLEAAALASLAFGVVTLLRNAARSAGRLTPDQVAVLLLLRSTQNPMRITELVAALSTGNHKWTDQRVSAALNALTAVVTRKDVVAIVKQDAEKRWVSVGV